MYITLYNWNTFRKRFVHNKYSIQYEKPSVLNDEKDERGESITYCFTWIHSIRSHEVDMIPKKITTFWTKQIDFTTKIHKICRLTVNKQQTCAFHKYNNFFSISICLKKKRIDVSTVLNKYDKNEMAKSRFVVIEIWNEFISIDSTQCLSFKKKNFIGESDNNNIYYLI